jgi:hypothetical protein
MSDKPATNVARLRSTPAATADIDFPTLIETVLEKGLDPQVIQSVLRMYNDHQDRRNQEALNAAVAGVCADIQPVLRDAQNKHLGNRYATHQGMMTMLQPLLHQHGVRVGFDVGAALGEQPVEPGYVRVRIVIGYGAYIDRNSYIDEPITAAGSQGGRTQMTQNQALTSATTYAQRTLLKLKFNIATVEDDDDGEGARGRDTQGTPGAEQQQQNARAGMTGGAAKTETKPAAETAPIDHEVWKAALRRRLHLAESEAQILELLAHPEIKAWLDAAPLRIKADADVLIAAKQKILADARDAAQAKADDKAEADVEIGTNTAAPSELLTTLLARVGSCLTTVALDSVVVAPEFTSEVVKLAFVEGDLLTEAIKARYAALGG